MSSPENGAPFAYKCSYCGKTEISRKPRDGKRCPQCLKETFELVEPVGGAVLYTIADRTRGPSIEDGRLGRMAFFADWMTLQQVAACLERQKQAATEARPAPRFGEVAVAEKFLTERQVTSLLRMQVIHNGPSTQDMSFGAIATRERFVAREEVDACLRIQKSLLQRYQEAPLLGILLVERKSLSSAQVKRILEIQAAAGAGPLASIRAEFQKAADSAGAKPAAATATTEEDLLRLRLLCRCEECKHAEMRAAWAPGDKCPSCGSAKFAPVPFVDDASLAEDNRGPSISDGRVGRLANFAGWMTLAEIQDCLKRQQEGLRQGQQAPRFGEIAVENGYLTQERLEALLRVQSLRHVDASEKAFGALALRNKFATREQLDECLAEQMRLLMEGHTAPPLGIMMQDKGILSAKQVKAILNHQARVGQGLLHELAASQKREIANPVRAVFKAAHSNSPGLGWAAAAVILLSSVAMGMGWLGGNGWRPPMLVVGCRACGHVCVMPARGSADCPSCKKVEGLCPLVRCDRCGAVYLYGPRGDGAACPACHSAAFTPVDSASAAAKAWSFKPPPPPPGASKGK
ncbi:MAG TPA: hypothetical protein P5137_14485 [Candidatus Brocadiia bacterium]|nr:hypothetical protein [Candidatus Brocadiia bacterium]